MGDVDYTMEGSGGCLCQGTATNFCEEEWQLCVSATILEQVPVSPERVGSLSSCAWPNQCIVV